jgi:hypothetical protein
MEDRTLMSTLAVVDVNTNVVLPANGATINSFSNWSMSLQAQVSGVAVTSYCHRAPQSSPLIGASKVATLFECKPPDLGTISACFTVRAIICPR